MNQTYLATLLNTLLEKAAVPQIELQGYMSRPTNKKDPSSLSFQDNYEQKANQINNQISKIEEKIVEIDKRAFEFFNKFESSFKQTIDQRKCVFKDAFQSLAYFYNQNKQKKGISHYIESFSKRKNLLVNEQTVEKTVTINDVISQTNLSHREKIKLLERGDFDVIMQTVESTDEIVDILRQQAINCFTYLDIVKEKQEVQELSLKPLYLQLDKLKQSHNKQVTAYMKEIISKLSPVKQGQSISDIYSNDPLYHLFIGKQKPEDGEFPTTLAMVVYKKLTKALIYASHIKVKGQKNQPAVFSALSQVFPEFSESDDKAHEITCQWYDWKFDLYSIQQSFICILQEKANKQTINTSLKQLNSYANNINPDQASLILSLLNQEAYAA